MPWLIAEEYTMSNNLHVVFGSGPVGSWIARTLVREGKDVRVVNRSGARGEFVPGDVEVRAADASNVAAATKAAEGAAVVYQALNPAYHLWHELFPALQAGALAAAKATGARYVSIENLYLYDSSAGPITEKTRIAPVSRKGALRARMAEEVIAAHKRGDVEAAILRSSDYYGPGVTASSLGDRVFPPILAGKKGEALAGLDIPHSYAYIEDVARAAVVLGARDEALGRAWIAPHAPAPTQRQVLDTVFGLAGHEPRYTVVAPWLMRAFGLFNKGAGEMVEMMYEFTEPFTVDSSAIEAAFDLTPTPLAEGLERTLDWYREVARGGTS
jgi:nucleoside-diphosphate-sugar epimerase